MISLKYLKIQNKLLESKINWIKAITFLSVILLFTNCKAPMSLGISEEMYQGYKPIEPTPVKSVEIYSKNRDTFIQRPWASLSDSVIRSLLPNQSAQIAMRKMNKSGKVSYLPVSVSHERGNYEVILDYMKYRVEDAADSVYLGNGRVGIGLRVKASLSTKKSNLNLSGLTNLGVEASKNNLSGFLSVDIIGIDSKDITNYLLIPAKLDEISIQNALQTISTIKSKIWDNDVTLTPHIIAVNQAVTNSEWAIKEKVTNIGEFGYTNSSEVLESFWKPNGTVDNKNEERIKEWIKNNLPKNKPVSITFLLYTTNMESYRNKAIKNLNLY